MPKVGRNDPCPCGSGKKYKNCHGRIERDQQALARTSWREFEDLADAFLQFTRVRPELVIELESAMTLFWNGDYGPAALGALSELDQYRFLDWFAFDYPIDRDKRRLIDVFAQERGPLLSEAKRTMLDGWTKTPLSLFRVLEAVPGRSVLVEDLLLGGEQRATEAMLSAHAKEGDLVLGRLLPAPQGASFALLPVLLPASLEQGMIAFMERAWANYQEIHYGAEKRAFLLESGYLLNHYLVRLAQDGQDVSEWADHHYDVAESLDALKEALEEELDLEEEYLHDIEDEMKEEDESYAPRFKTIADGRLIIPGTEPPPKPAESDKTFADGKLLLP